MADYESTQLSERDPRLAKKTPQGCRTKECPRCFGNGSFVLRPDSYGPGKHFEQMCPSCWSHGYVLESQTCAHEWKAAGNVGNCLNRWVCVRCNESRVVDSSG